jgi:hypothetical protein
MGKVAAAVVAALMACGSPQQKERWCLNGNAPSKDADGRIQCQADSKPNPPADAGYPVLLVEQNELPWCYVDNRGIWGGRCSDTEALCEAELKRVRDQVYIDAVEHLRAKMEFEKASQAGARMAVDTWRMCKQESSACFTGKDTVSGVKLRWCTTRMADCQGDRQSMTNVDFTPETTCAIVRLRR